MTPKEKAIELRDKFYFNTSLTDLEEVKECALIAVDEVLNSILGNYEFDFLREYWQEVKQELQNLK